VKDKPHRCLAFRPAFAPQEQTMAANIEDARARIHHSGYHHPGFAATYDAARPPMPPVAIEIILRVARIERPRLVVDLGCGKVPSPGRGPPLPTPPSVSSRTRRCASRPRDTGPHPPTSPTGLATPTTQGWQRARLHYIRSIDGVHRLLSKRNPEQIALLDQTEHTIERAAGRGPWPWLWRYRMWVGIR
jgi:hypothetical protein